MLLFEDDFRFEAEIYNYKNFCILSTFVFIEGSKFLNKIPNDIRAASCQSEIRKRLKQLIINKALYSLDDF
jgi:hypothetical protein